MMRHDTLVNLIGTLDPNTFRDIARRCLVARGYRPASSDGPGDGAADFLVYLRGVEPAPCAVQVTVEKKWKTKLKEDAAKANRNGFSTLLFVSSRRLPNQDFFRVEDELSQTFDIKIHKMDAQDIADLAIDRSFVSDLLNMVGVPTTPLPPRPFDRPKFRQDAAYACAFFGSDARELRKVALQETICAALTNAGGRAARESIVDQVALGMGLAASQRPQVISAMDRLLQEGRIRGKNGEISLDEKELHTRQSVYALAQANIKELRAKLDDYLEPFVKRKARIEAVRESLLEDIGALLMDTAARTSAAVANSDSLSDGVRSRLMRLESTLESVGLTSDERRRAIGDLARIASESEYGKHLMTGEIALQLFHLRTSHLLRALESRDELRVVLDTSVAMPMLCNLLYSPADQQYFVASQHLYEQLLAHSIPAILPAHYLEEIASHLIDAYRDYQEVIDIDPDLRGSTNAFVAHYVAMKQVEPYQVGAFSSYLEAFGLDETLARSNFYVARDAVMRRLQSLLGQYHIRCEVLRAEASPRRQAEEAILEAQRNGGFNRPKVLLDHDAATLGWLFGRESDAQVAYIICTWDRLHFQVHKARKPVWDALDPVALGDILSLAAPEGQDLHLASAWVLALRFSDEAATRGAEIWDTLIRLEKGHLHDAALREQARAFKASWMVETGKDPRTHDLQKAWEHWKSEHLPSR